MTTTPALAERITKLERSVRAAGVATKPAQKRAALQFVTQRAIDLTERRDSMFDASIQAGSLVTQWDWLSKHKDDPRNHAFEEQWIAAETEYRLICDAIEAAKVVWLPDAMAVAS